MNATSAGTGKAKGMCHPYITHLYANPVASLGNAKRSQRAEGDGRLFSLYLFGERGEEEDRLRDVLNPCESMISFGGP